MATIVKHKLNKGTNVAEVFKKKPELQKKLAKKLSKSFDINDFLAYFLENRSDDVKELVEEELHQHRFPEEAEWDTVLWSLSGRNRVEFTKWLDIAVQKHYINGEDIADKLDDFIRSDRDYKMFAAEWRQLLNIDVKLLENVSEWYERQGKVKELAKILSTNFDPDYIGLRLASPELLEATFNPVSDVFRNEAEQLGFPKEATTINTRFKVIPTMAVDFEEFANYLTGILREKDGQVDNLLRINNRQINEVYLSHLTISYLAIRVTILDTLEEWEERNQILSDNSRAKKLLSEMIERMFDPILLGEEFSTVEMLDQPQNICERKVQEKLHEENFPKQATAYNVDFDASAKSALPYTEVAEHLIEASGNNFEAINNMMHANQERFNFFWKLPQFMRILDFDITLNQTKEDWLSENADRLADEAAEKEDYEDY